MKEKIKKPLKSPFDPERLTVEGWPKWEIWAAVIAIVISTAGLIVYQKNFKTFTSDDESSIDSNEVDQPSFVHNIFDWQRSASIWGGRDSHASVVFLDKMWVIGGKDANDKSTNDVWSSLNGSSWTIVTENNRWTDRSGHQAIVFNGKIWIMGGITNDGYQLNDIWSSSDGITWTKELAIAPWSARSDFSTVVFKDKLYLLGGWSNSSPQNGEFTNYNDVWATADGINWSQITEDAGWDGRGYLSAYIHDEKMFIAGGMTLVPQQNFSSIYSSYDGVTWTKVGDLPESRSAACVVIAEDRLYYIDGYNEKRAYNYSFYSDDGMNWLATETNAYGPRRSFHTALYFKNKIWMIGGTDLDAGRANDLWSTEIIGDK